MLLSGRPRHPAGETEDLVREGSGVHDAPARDLIEEPEGLTLEEEIHDGQRAELLPAVGGVRILKTLVHGVRDRDRFVTISSEQFDRNVGHSVRDDFHGAMRGGVVGVRLTEIVGRVTAEARAAIIPTSGGILDPAGG